MPLHGNSGFPPGLVIGLFILIAVVGAIYSFYAARQRREALRRIALIKRLQFYPDDVFGLLNLYGAMRLCSQGHSRVAWNVIAGPKGCGEIQYFDYRYTTGEGKNSQTHSASGCGFRAPFFFTRLYLRPENFLDKAAGFLGFEDIDLDNAEFNRKFYVSSEDKKFAYDVLNQRAIEFLLARPGICMEMNGNSILFSYNRRISADEVAALIETASSFCDLLPNFLREDRSLHPASSQGPAAAAGDLENKGLRFGGIEPTPRRSTTDNP